MPEGFDFQCRYQPNLFNCENRRTGLFCYTQGSLETRAAIVRSRAILNLDYWKNYCLLNGYIY